LTLGILRRTKTTGSQGYPNPMLGDPNPMRERGAIPQAKETSQPEV
jgi:hypothetical protein